ncbi:hypothetical protein JHL22_15120 [Advenella sp. WQ 585]|uniref:DUF1376 domain-containing protein n=1 Tax=Advenella mandrilli TaxID=2800330 RepID=A0ABS1EHQ1_9BURK|nr:hypothetical protein [Advenella mandrilli]MBK1782542.1 hypothetical protein [Advenella mandrilli]
MSNPSMPWFRMYTDFLNDPKMISLAFEDQRHFVGILALKSDGMLEQDCDPELMDKIVAQRLWIDRGVIREVKKRLVNAGLIYEDWQPVAWNKRQKISDHDSTNAERQKRYRIRQKQEQERLKQEQENTNETQDTDFIEQNKTKEVSNDTITQRNALRNVTVTQLDKNRIDKNRRDKSNDALLITPPSCPIQEIVDLYHKHMPENPKVKILDNKRIRAITEKWNEAATSNNKPFGYQTVEDGLKAWEVFFEICNDSDFLTGKVAPGPGRTIPFIAELDFLVSDKGFKGCLENKYHRENV